MRDDDARSRDVVALFDDRRRALDAISRARSTGAEVVTTFSPAYDRELVEATAIRSRSVNVAALVGSVGGCLAGLALTVWTTAQWPTLIVGGKPLISIPPYVLIMFELTVLFASIAGVAAFLWRAGASRPRDPRATDPAFSDARFGMLVRGNPSQIAQAIDAVLQAGAVEWRFV